MAPLVVHVTGARPNFPKAAPVLAALGEQPVEQLLVHTGQHYDDKMSDVFFRQLGIPKPDVNLGVGSGSHGRQTAKVMEALEELFEDRRPDMVIVYGDVNSTVAAALVASKMGIAIAHVEAGLRSFDMTMPEEINRLVTDVLCDVLWTPSPDADANLAAEGIPSVRVTRVGNIMMDSFELIRPQLDAEAAAARLNMKAGGYGIVTLHRPANVDDAQQLATIVDALCTAQSLLPLVFPVHPRTRQRLAAAHLDERLAQAGVLLLEPLSYKPFMSLLKDARLAITDSGGLQEETTYLGIPCLTMRENTERPITISEGTNRLTSPAGLLADIRTSLGNDAPRPVRPQYWDGATAGRCVDDLRARRG